MGYGRFKGLQDADKLFYNITEETEYSIRVSHESDITKLTDRFISHAKLQDEWGAGAYYPVSNWQPLYKMGPLRVLCEEWSKMIKPGSGCTTLTTPEIKAALKTVGPHIMDQVAPHGYYVHGQRIYCRESMDELATKRYKREQKLREEARKREAARPYKRPQEITWNDWMHLKEAMRDALDNRYKVDFSIRDYGTDNYTNIMHFYKKLLNWPEVKAAFKKNRVKKKFPQDVVFLKKLWDGERPNYFKRWHEIEGDYDYD